MTDNTNIHTCPICGTLNEFYEDIEKCSNCEEFYDRSGNWKPTHITNGAFIEVHESFMMPVRMCIKHNSLHAIGNMMQLNIENTSRHITLDDELEVLQQAMKSVQWRIDNGRKQ